MRARLSWRTADEIAVVVDCIVVVAAEDGVSESERSLLPPKTCIVFLSSSWDQRLHTMFVFYIISIRTLGRTNECEVIMKEGSVVSP